MVFEEVQSDLEAEGYEVQLFILPAAGVGAPHRRDRVWIVAYSDRYDGSRIENEKYSTERRQQALCRTRQRNGDGVTSNAKGKQSKWMQSEQREFSQQRQREFRGDSSPMGCWDATDTSDTRLQGSEKFRSIASERQESYKQPAGRICTTWQNFPTQSPVCDGDDGISADLVRYILRTGGDCYTEEEAEKEAKRIISKVRAEGIKAGGNAIVHQVVLQIFKAIEEFENQLQKPALRL
mgnify:CR=1 FL=1